MWNFNWPIFLVGVCASFFLFGKKKNNRRKQMYLNRHTYCSAVLLHKLSLSFQSGFKKKKKRPSVPWNNGTISEYQCSALHISIQGKHTGWRKYPTEFMFLPCINTPHPQQVIAHKTPEWLELQRWMKRTYSSHVTCISWMSTFPPLAPC